MRTSFWTRRTSIGTAAALVTAAMVMAPSIPARQIPKDCSVLVLYNAKVLTMDQRNTIASSVIIEDEHIAEVSTSRGVPKHNGCAKLVDLHGRTVIPGLIENHDHFLTLGLRPGHDTRLETASSISEVPRVDPRPHEDHPNGRLDYSDWRMEPYPTSGETLANSG